VSDLVRWTDNHCHITTAERKGGTPAEIVDAAAQVGVERLITVGCTLADSNEALAIASEFAGVWATAGIHPHEAANGVDGLEELLAAGNVVAVGEAGLDYFYEHSPKVAQAEAFVAQIDMANRHDLPLVIHSRDAWDDTFAILDSTGVPARTVFHCFTGGPGEATKALERGCYLSFSGIVTFPSAPELREAAALAPLDRIMVETDSPYLAPVPHRGKSNHPANVTIVGEAVAAEQNADVAEVAQATWNNASRFYGLD
jgi:TatD DNase family protein